MQISKARLSVLGGGLLYRIAGNFSPSEHVPLEAIFGAGSWVRPEEILGAIELKAPPKNMTGRSPRRRATIFVAPLEDGVHRFRRRDDKSAEGRHSIRFRGATFFCSRG